MRLENIPWEPFLDFNHLAITPYAKETEACILPDTAVGRIPVGASTVPLLVSLLPKKDGKGTRDVSAAPELLFDLCVAFGSDCCDGWLDHDVIDNVGVRLCEVCAGPTTTLGTMFPLNQEDCEFYSAHDEQKFMEWWEQSLYRLGAVVSYANIVEWVDLFPVVFTAADLVSKSKLYEPYTVGEYRSPLLSERWAGGEVHE